MCQFHPKWTWLAERELKFIGLVIWPPTKNRHPSPFFPLPFPRIDIGIASIMLFAYWHCFPASISESHLFYFSRIGVVRNSTNDIVAPLLFPYIFLSAPLLWTLGSCWLRFCRHPFLWPLPLISRPPREVWNSLSSPLQRFGLVSFRFVPFRNDQFIPPRLLLLYAVDNETAVSKEETEGGIGRGGRLGFLLLLLFFLIPLSILALLFLSRS